MEIVLVAVIASIVGPATMTIIAGRQRRKEKELDWARQDKLTERIRKQNEENNKHTQAKLDTISAFVDGEKTAAMQRELAALRRELIVLQEVVRLREKNDLDPSPETEQEIITTETKIDELAREIEQRMILIKQKDQREKNQKAGQA